ncbi:MAG TPA: YehR family protein [Candidatus Mediterraneibacter tabaqchaliae]|uniref:YehR family protein n=1 Tax=Candidatus Mediterraneibacter tabaqchaliae TaxID=2838689 RepID=A0A9D2R2U5_9FIRM|nr:YehR family protein [Candidatus Mediterraneibacter tabaqchaliae]
MKRHMCAVVAGAAVLCFTACGGEEEVRNAATATIEQNGVTMTMSFDAKGDEVTRITQESVIDLSGYSEEMIDALNSTVESAEETYAEVEGVEYSCGQEDGKMVERIVIPTDKDTLRAAVEQGLLPVDDEDVTQLSLKATTDNLEAAGWTVETAE